MNKPIRVIVVDDSSLVRTILANGLSKDPDIQVVATAPDPYVARDKIIKYRPDVLTLDVEMPRMNGVEFLRRLMPQFPIPVVMVSSLTQKGKSVTLDALEAGAVDFISKPLANVPQGLAAMIKELRAKVKIASTANVTHWKSINGAKDVLSHKGNNDDIGKSKVQIIAIGASTGGTEAIKRVVAGFPANTPGVIVVQHMPAGFTRMFAERLNDICAMDAKEAESGDEVIPGRILVAPGQKHLTLRRIGGSYKVTCNAGQPVSGYCPSVDVMMRSVAENAGANAVGVILTGMGHDGSDGILAMREAGAGTVAQDEASSIVFGMPNEAFKNGGAQKLVALDKITGEVIRLLTQ